MDEVAEETGGELKEQAAGVAALGSREVRPWRWLQDCINLLLCEARAPGTADAVTEVMGACANMVPTRWRGGDRFQKNARTRAARSERSGRARRPVRKRWGEDAKGCLGRGSS